LSEVRGAAFRALSKEPEAMLIKASTRPLGLKRGVRTEAFYKAAGFKDRPDLSSVVGTLTLSARHATEFRLLRDLYEFFANERAGNLTIRSDQGETVYESERPRESDEAA
jgi:hypothetical protein